MLVEALMFSDLTRYQYVHNLECGALGMTRITQVSIAIVRLVFKFVSWCLCEVMNNIPHRLAWPSERREIEEMLIIFSI